MKIRIGIVLMLATLLLITYGRTPALFAQSGHSITLTWTASKVDATHPAPTSYIINRGTAAGAEVANYATVAGGVTTFQDTNGVGGTTYFYTVTASDASQPGGGNAAPSNEASATFLVAGSPNPVTGLGAAAN